MKDFNKYFIVGTNQNALYDTMNGTVTGELIRCKDCKHWYEKYRHGVDMSTCKRAIGYFGANDYCSRAERKEHEALADTKA